MLIPSVKRLQNYQQRYFYSFSLKNKNILSPFPQKADQVLKANKNHSTQTRNWYQESQKFWKNTSPEVQGVMMGRAELNPIDIQNSQSFLERVSFKKTDFKRGSVLDCGAGIGRISTNLLKHKFKQVDMLEKSQDFVAVAQQNRSQTRYRHFYCSGLQDFDFVETYDALWIQWVLTHIHDEEVIAFLQKARMSLNEGGVIFVKQNYCTSEPQIVDRSDCTIVRSSYRWRSLFYQAGCRLYAEQDQQKWPSELYAVKMWALI